jgi:hypothetical protein
MGFRFKRPDISANDGWQFPNINLKHLFGNDAAGEDRRWRYENFNFTVGIDYPF